MDDKNKNEDGTAVTGAGGSTDHRFGKDETEDALTNRQDHPITDNQNVR